MYGFGWGRGSWREGGCSFLVLSVALGWSSVGVLVMRQGCEMVFNAYHFYVMIVSRQAHLAHADALCKKPDLVYHLHLPACGCYYQKTKLYPTRATCD